MAEDDRPDLSDVVDRQIKDIFGENLDAFAFASRIEELNRDQIGRPISVSLIAHEQESREQMSGIIFSVTPNELQHAVMLNNGKVLIVGPAKSDPSTVDIYKKALAPSPISMIFGAEYADLEKIAEMFYEGRNRFGSTVLMRNNDEENAHRIQKLVNQGIALAEEKKKEKVEASDLDEQSKEGTGEPITIFSDEMTIWKYSLGIKAWFRKNK